MGEAAPIRTPDTQLFRDIFNASPIGIAVEDMEGQPLFVNRAFCSFLGFTEEELRCKHCVDFSPPEDAQKDWALFQQLRAGAIENYQLEKRYFRRDGSLVWGRLSVSLLNGRPSSLILAMVEDITDKKAVEEAIRASEEHLRFFVKNVPAGVAMLDRDMRYLQVSDRFCADYGINCSQVLGRSHYEFFPDIPQHWKEIHRRGLQGETLRADEDRWDREDGRSTWVRWEIRPWRTAGGAVGGILIFAEDITHRKQMEEALTGVSRKLIESQEQDRARIGRELHDDITQRLALLTVELDQLQKAPSQIQSRLRKLQKEITEIANDVQALSHELHSSRLEVLGVVKGLRGWSREFSARQRMQIDFKTDVFTALPLDIGLCLLRVLQEALHNAGKHSGAKRIEVQLTEHAHEVHLTVSDSGKGFDLEVAKQGTGLGLTSMQERVRLIDGTIAIESKPMGGTTIRVRIPLQRNAEQAAG